MIVKVRPPLSLLFLLFFIVFFLYIFSVDIYRLDRFVYSLATLEIKSCNVCLCNNNYLQMTMAVG